MASLEDLLKEKGYTDEELKTLAPMLTDVKFRTTLESTVGEYQSRASKAEESVTGWAKWYTDEAIPTLDKHLEAAASAKARAAELEARMQYLNEQGLGNLTGTTATTATQPPVANAYGGNGGTSNEGFDAKKYNVPTWDDLHRVANAEGEAIAMAQDMSAEHYALFGKPLAGFRELRNEAVSKRIPVVQLWEQKYNIAAKRAEAEAARTKAYEDSIRSDERKRVIGEFANPNSRPPSDSMNPFVKRPDSADKQPWDKDPNQRATERISRAVSKLM